MVAWVRDRVELLAILLTMVGTAVSVAFFVNDVAHQVELLRKDLGQVIERVDRTESNGVTKTEMENVRLRVELLEQQRVTWAAQDAWLREFAARNPGMNVPLLVR